jgi:predicted DNA-binding transcriptional regulator YafY
MSRKGQSITLSISDRDKKELENLALEYGLTWGDRANISKLVEAIARRQLLISPNNDWSPERIKAIDAACKALIDKGEIQQAQEIARLLRERSELTIAVRTEIEKFLNNPQPAWRQQVDNFIHRQQPFRLSYQDAADRHWSFTVLFARVQTIEKRQYLVCRCEEFEGNQDIEELCHNWTLRLDRISEAAVAPINQPWIRDLDRITVELHLYGGLAFAYRSDPINEDLDVSKVEGDPPFRRVTRNIFNTFWFFRDIAKYLEECEIVSPENVRILFAEKVNSLYRKYSFLTHLPD